MKKLLFEFLFIVLLLTISGCANKNSETSSVTDYFPAKENVLYEYIDEGSGELNHQIFNLHISDSRMQRIIKTDIYPLTEILEFADGEVKLVFGDQHNLYFDDVTSFNQKEFSYILKEPLILGNTWNFNSKEKCEITSLNAHVTTPIGDFDTLEVTHTSPDLIQKNYYAKGIGLVKVVYKYENQEYIVNLSSITEETVYVVEYDFYYPDASEDTLAEKREISLTTNCSLTDILEEEFKKPAASMSSALISDDIEFNNISIDWQTYTLTLDTSNELSEQIKKIVSQTLIGFFEVERVEFTVK